MWTFRIAAMSNGAWRGRLREALERSGKSMREVSLAAGQAHGYLHDLLKTDKEPAIGNLVALSDALGVSITWLVYGVEMSADAEKLVRLFGELSPDQRKHLLAVAESVRKLEER